MANAFVLFGKLQVDSSDFTRALNRAESELKNTERAIANTEQKARSLGKTTATSARGFDKMRESVRGSQQSLRSHVTAFQNGQITQRQFARALSSTETGIGRVSSRLADTNARLTDFAARGRGVMGTLASMRAGLVTAGVALTGVSYGIGQAAMEVSDWQNILKSATGSSASAAAKFKELNAVAQRSPGVMTKTAVSTYALLKPMNIAEGTINSLIQAFGRIKLSLPTADINKFAFNINQLFTNFDTRDFREAVENFPRFGEIVKKAFDLQSAKDDIGGIIKELRKLKEAGKLSKDAWLKGLGDAINADISLGKLEDTIRTKFEKLVERIQISIAPIGETVAASAFNIFDTVTWGDAIQGFFVSASALILQGGLALLTTIATIFGEISIALASPFLSDTAIADMRKNISDTYTSLSTDIAGMEVEFYNTMREQRIQSLNNILNDPAASQALKDIAQKQLDGLKQGMSEGTKTAQTTIQQSGATLQKTLTDLAANVNLSPELRKKLQEEVTKVGDSVKTGVNASQKKIVAGSKDLQDALNKLLADVRISPNLRNAIAKELKQIEETAKKAAAAVPKQIQVIPDQIAENIFKPKSLPSDGLIKLLQDPINKGKEEGKKGGLSVGQQLALGAAAGIAGGESGVINAAIHLALAAKTAAENALGIQSPSKVFFQIGKDVAQGFIDGIAAMRASVQGSMASLLDVTGIQGLAKKDATGVQLLTGLINDLARLNVVTKEQEVLLELTAGKYAKLNEEVRTRILLAAQELDRLNAVNEAQELMREILEAMGPGIEKSYQEVVAENLRNEAWKGLNETMRERLKLLARFADFAQRKPGEEILPQGRSQEGGIGTGGLGGLDADEIRETREELETPPRFKMWADFWTSMRVSMNEFVGRLPSIKQALGENLAGALMGIADVFANAVAQWDVAIGGFFKSVARGFVEMSRQIIAELIRIMIYKALLNLFGSLAGGLGGSTHAPSSIGSAAGHTSPGGRAAGGLVSGRGTGTSDSILARLSNGEFVMPAKAVQHWGVGFMEQLRGLQAPAMAFAGGGLAGGGSVYNNQRSASYQVTVNMPSQGGSNGLTRDQVQRAVLDALHKAEQRRK